LAGLSIFGYQVINVKSDRRRKRHIERSFIRHPSTMPIRFDLQGDCRGCARYLRNVSEGGVCFATAAALDAGVRLRLKIPVFDQLFEIDATVAWCRSAASGFEVGVRFDSVQDRFSVRMVEQLVYIEDYRRQVEREEGRTMSSEQAAKEWVERYAERFPRLN
jgi:hypothetical protein